MYKCDKCGCEKIVESTTFIARDCDVVIITEDDKIVCNNPVFDFANAELQGYFCKDYGHPVIEKESGYRVKTEAQLVKFLKGA